MARRMFGASRRARQRRGYRTNGEYRTLHAYRLHTTLDQDCAASWKHLSLGADKQQKDESDAVSSTPLIDENIDEANACTEAIEHWHIRR